MNNFDRAKTYAESFNRSGSIKPCPYCKTSKLYVVHWADDDIGYVVNCNCKKVISTRWEDCPEKAITYWNEKVDKDNPMSEIKKLVKYLSDDEIKQLTSELMLLTNR